MRVRVFRNLTSRCLSIQAKIGRRWLTVAHTSHVVLGDATFHVSKAGRQRARSHMVLGDVTLHVSEAGRQRALRTGRKMVHAWVEGDLRAFEGAVRPAGAPISSALWAVKSLGGPSFQEAYPVAVTYNPRRSASFVTRETGEPVVSAEAAYLSECGVKCYTPRGPLA